MGFVKKLFGRFSRVSSSVKQSRQIAEKLNDTHIKYAVIKTDTDDLIVGREGHVNIVDKDCFELVFGTQSVFKFKIDQMQIWEFMSLDGATVTGYDLNDDYEKTFIIYYDKHLER
ncbi:MAG: hypothetical protein IJ939_03500 [Clostridia bacterium]|nr:hypothetical protein [Clostridia bacterium]